MGTLAVFLYYIAKVEKEICSNIIIMYSVINLYLE